MHIHGWTAIAAAALAFVATTSSPAFADDPNDAISQSQVQQGLAASPVPASQLNFSGKNPYLVALGSYLVWIRQRVRHLRRTLRDENRD